MSVSNVVFIPRGALPTQSAWQAALASLDARLVFDHTMNMRTHVGGVVLRLGPSRTGFEYDISGLRSYFYDVDEDDFTPAERKDLQRTFGHVVSLITHSSASGYMASTLAAAALAIASGGRILDCGTGVYFNANEAQAWAQEIVAGLVEHVERELLEQGQGSSA